MPRSGPMRERVTIQQSSVPVDDLMGGGDKVWSAIATTPTVWARIAPLRGDERMAALQLQSSVTLEVTLRYRNDLTTAMRLLWGSVVLNIRAVLHDEKHRHTRLMVEQGAPS